MSAQSIRPPPGAKSIDQLLAEARSNIQRLTPSQLHQELQEFDPGWGPTHLVDIRPAAQRAAEGALALTYSQDKPSIAKATDKNTGLDHLTHKVHIIERNVLEWRLDPQSEAKIEDIVNAHGYDTMVVVVCSEGYTSSLAANELQKLGLRNATDLNGGYWSWKGFLEGNDGGPQHI